MNRPAFGTQPRHRFAWKAVWCSGLRLTADNASDHGNGLIGSKGADCALSFRSLSSADFPLLQRWLSEPHVEAWADGYGSQPSYDGEETRSASSDELGSRWSGHCGVSGVFVTLIRYLSTPDPNQQRTYVRIRMAVSLILIIWVISRIAGNFINHHW
jgi:hypothetical protein